MSGETLSYPCMIRFRVSTIFLESLNFLPLRESHTLIGWDFFKKCEWSHSDRMFIAKYNLTTTDYKIMLEYNNQSISGEFRRFSINHIGNKVAFVYNKSFRKGMEMTTVLLLLNLEKSTIQIFPFPYLILAMALAPNDKFAMISTDEGVYWCEFSCENL